MKMKIRRDSLLILRILIFFFLLQSSVPLFGFVSGQNCVRLCGSGGGGNPVSVPYPFGFSSGCPIQLDSCESGSTADVKFKGYKILNFTATSLILDFPANCSRNFSDWKLFFDKSYALTNRTSLLLKNCSVQQSSSACIVSSSLIEERLSSNCSSSGEISCFSNSRNGYLQRHALENLDNCRNLLSSVAIVEKESPEVLLSLYFQRLEIGWWMIRESHQIPTCAPNSTISEFTSPINTSAFRCRCPDGFQGDGFKEGDGCKQISASLPPSKCDASAAGYFSVQCGGIRRLALLVGGIVAGIGVIATSVIVCCCFFSLRRGSYHLRSKKSTKRLLSEVVVSSSVPFYTYREIEKSTNYFSEKQMVGTGAYGRVYAGKLNNGDWVAVKKIRRRDSVSDGIEQVMNEIKLLSSVSHPNLVRLLGCCIEREEQILVYEFMPNGTLSQHLQRERGNGLSWPVRLTIATETAHAIAHLHSIHPPIYHRDIKSSNILLDYNFKSKVADFGLSRMVLTESSHVSTAPQGTPGYLDPQYHQNFHLSDKSDVYSFGVVLVEIITALKVVDFSRSHGEVNLAALAADKIGRGCVDEIVDSLLEPDTDAWTLSTIHKVAELAFRCLAFHKDMRPGMVEVCMELDNIRSSFDHESNCEMSSCSSVSSSSRSHRTSTTKKKGRGGSKMFYGGKSSDDETNIVMSPVSVQEIWFSEQSSPSTNSRLDHVVQ